MKKIWFSKMLNKDKQYNVELSFKKNNALFDLWLQKDEHHLDENGILNYYEFRISILKLQIDVFVNIFY